MALAASLAIILLVNGVRISTSEVLSSTNLMFITQHVSFTKLAEVPGSPLSEDEYLQLFNMLMPHSRAEAVCRIRLLSGCENRMIVQLDQYENHGEIPKGIICTDFTGAPFFTDFCTFTHYRCTRKRYYIKRVNCPDKTPSIAHIMTYWNSIMDREGNIMVTPSGTEVSFSPESSQLLDESTIEGLIPEEEMLFGSINSLQLDGSDAVPRPRGGRLTTVSIEEASDNVALLSRVTSQRDNENKAPMAAIEGLLDNITSGPDGHWLTLEVGGEEMVPGDIAFHNGKIQRFTGSDATLRRLVLKNHTFSPGRWWEKPEVEQEAKGSDEELFVSNGINSLAGGREMEITTNQQIVEGKISSRSQGQWITEGKTFTASVRWWTPKRVPKTTHRRGILQVIVKGGIFDRLDRWPSPELDTQAPVVDEESGFKSGFSQHITGTDVQGTASERITAGTLFTSSRRLGMPAMITGVMPSVRIASATFPDELPEWKVDVTIPNKESMFSGGLRQLIVRARPRERIVERTTTQPAPEQSVGATVAGQETFFSGSIRQGATESINEIMPRAMMVTTKIRGEEKVVSSDLFQWLKQRVADLMQREGILEKKPRERLVEMIVPDQGFRPFPSRGMEDAILREAIAVETIPADEALRREGFRLGMEGRRVAVEIPEDEKVYSTDISLEATERNTGMMGSFKTRGPTAGQATSPHGSPSENAKGISNSTDTMQWDFSTRKKLTWSRLSSPAPSGTLLISVTPIQTSRSGINFEKLVNELLKISYGDSAYNGSSTMAGTWSTREGGATATFTWKEKARWKSTSVPKKTSVRTIRILLNRLGTRSGRLSWKGPKSRGSTLNPGRWTMVKSRSGGEIWNGDMEDLYKRLQDPTVQKLSKDLQEKLARNGMEDIGNPELQDLSLQLMKALSNLGGVQ